MKKLTSIFIACFYLVLSVGVAKSTHFCMGRALPSTVFSYQAKKCFCGDVKEKEDDCCKDQFELVKIENDQSSSQVVDSPAPEFNFIGEFFSEVIIESVVHNQQNKFVAESNQPPPKVPIYQINCSFIFYESVI